MTSRHSLVQLRIVLEPQVDACAHRSAVHLVRPLILQRILSPVDPAPAVVSAQVRRVGRIYSVGGVLEGSVKT